MTEPNPKDSGENPLVPHASDLLSDTQRLHQITIGSDEFAEALMAEAPEGIVREDIDVQVDKLRRRVLDDIILPESVAVVANREARKLVEDSTHGIGHMSAALNAMIESENSLSDAMHGLEQEITTLRRTLSDVREMRGYPIAEEDLPRIRSRFSAYIEGHNDATRVMEVRRSDVDNGSVHLRTSSAPIAEDARGSFRLIQEAETSADTDPQSLYEEGIEEKVKERGAATVEEHKYECDKEITEADSLAGVVSNRFGEVMTLSLEVHNLAKSSGIGDLTSAAHLEGLLNNISERLGRVIDQGDTAWQSVYDALDAVEASLDGILRVEAPRIYERSSDRKQRIDQMCFVIDDLAARVMSVAA